MTDRSPSNSISFDEFRPDQMTDDPPVANAVDEPDVPPPWFRGKSKPSQSVSDGSPSSERVVSERRPPIKQRNSSSRPPQLQNRPPIQDAETDDSTKRNEIVHPRAWYLVWLTDLQNLVTGRVKFARLGLLISFSLHFMVLALLGLWIVSRDREQQVEIVAELSEQTQPTEFEEVDLQFNALPEFKPEGQNTVDELPPVSTENLAIDANVQTLLEGGDGPVGDVGGGIVLPPQALKKGSFAVWTEPRDPIPKEPYYIIIDVDISSLDKKLKSYPKRDLSGSVVGTDNYEQDFGGRRERGNLPIVDEHVRMKVLVPGAARLVRDTIKVKSKLLNEEQTITIVF
ncbi:hypothetical protein [Thalassoroseus pseudoceratinae]|uniref:hypothetical protein n=1 Tax=Thalassoroseus pseudoceratinae TaxID=2713176 RepID=UPI001421FBFE|nr:hypothetical protein [Thalassoroseus pseudoceratinae]